MIITEEEIKNLPMLTEEQERQMEEERRTNTVEQTLREF